MDYLTPFKDRSQDCRCAFIVKSNKLNLHSITVSYIKEKGREVLIYNNSVVNDLIDKSKVKKLKAKSGMEVLFFQETRQSDAFSCHLDALIFSRDLTAKDKGGRFKVRNILKYTDFAASGEIKKIPSELIKGAQVSRTYQTYKSDDKASKFRERYKRKNPTRHDIPDYGYLRIKGLKLVNIIEIEFYRGQLEEKFLEVLDEGNCSNALQKKWSSFEERFIKLSKEKFQSQGPISIRKGLHEFAEQQMNELQKILEKAKEKETSSKHKVGLRFCGLPSCKSIIPNSVLKLVSQDRVMEGK